MPLSSSSRPHDPGNDYHAPGIYLITLVVRGRSPVLGRLNMDARNPGVELTPLGEVIRNEWEVTPAFQAKKHGRQLRILAQSVMPDHWHTVVEVLAPMDKPLGFVVQGYKSVCTSRWRKLRGLPSIKSQTCTSEMIRSMSVRKRAQFYASPERSRFDACTSGNLLILAPWQIDGAQDYDQFHNMNRMVQEVSECGIEVVIKADMVDRQ